MDDKTSTKERTTIYLDEKTLMDLKIYCVKNKTTVTKIVNKLLSDFLKEKI